jgi:hypothetical protein
MTSEYAYPPDLARFVQERWASSAATGSASVAPEFVKLKLLFSACYQASLLREEERPVTFRAILAPPELFSPDGMPPEQLQRLALAESLVLEASELRRLSVAADTQRTLIGVHEDAHGALRIWGIINSGVRWLRDTHGGRRAGAPLPDVPVVHVDAPGSLAVYRGQELVAGLRSGRLWGTRTDPFVSAWLPERFTDFREGLVALHEAARNRSDATWAPLAPDLPRMISQRVLKRVISLLREARHGGAIIFVPIECADPSGAETYIDLKYRFEAPPTQRSFQHLVVSILNRLAQIYGAGPRPNDQVGWREFETTPDDELATLDEALFESAHLIAGLAAADGAVVLTKLHDLLGFGGMITGRLPAIRSVAKARDLNAESTVDEPVEKVGARHRSAYRLVAALPGAVVIVVSQDGGVRFVAQKDGRVTYWELD